MNRELEKLNLEDVLTDQALEEDVLEVPLADKVFKVFFLLILTLTSLAFFRLIYLGIFKHSFYKARAVTNMTEVQLERAPRGVILDRFGEPLLHNEPSLNVFFVPQDLPVKSEEKLAVLEKIRKILKISLEELSQKIKTKDWSLNNRLFLTNDLTQDQVVELSASPVPGLQIEPSFRRVPKDPFAFAHVVGYTGLVDEEDLEDNAGLAIHDEIGKMGLEAYYDKYLRGESGKKIVIRDAKGEVQDKRVLNLGRRGLELETFIDRELQKYFYERLKEGLLVLGSKKGVGIALNPQNGEVLSLLSLPSFDTSKVVQFLNSSDQPFFNRVISGAYSPGSTIKPLVAIAALKEKIINPKKQIFSAGFIEIPNPYHPESPSRFLDWKPHGWVDMYSAIAKSSNVYFYAVGGGFEDQKGLGVSKLKKWWQRFKLDQKTAIDLMGEKNGFLPDPDWKKQNRKEPWYLGDTYNVSIGQGDLTVTPLALLNYISAIANHGKLYAPKIMRRVKSEQGEIILQSTPTILTDLQEEIDEPLLEVQRGMEEAVRKPYGTAHTLNDLPISVAAKTGTAQIENNKKTNAFFVGYAPAKNPEIAILVLVEDSREGSLNTLPIAKDVLRWYYKNRIIDQKSNIKNQN